MGVKSREEREEKKRSGITGVGKDQERISIESETDSRISTIRKLAKLNLGKR